MMMFKKHSEVLHPAFVLCYNCQKWWIHYEEGILTQTATVVLWVFVIFSLLIHKTGSFKQLLADVTQCKGND